MEYFGPWTRDALPGLGDGAKIPVWRPETQSAPETGGGAKHPKILIHGQCSSTMDAGWDLIRRGILQEWDSVVAVVQTRGRGQKQRQWISPAGNLHVSWRWPLPPAGAGSGPQWSGLVSLMAGFILAHVMEAIGIHARIKWPNDLLLEDPMNGPDRKFGGILVERRDPHILLGCGMNLLHCPDDSQLRAEAAVPAARILDLAPDLSPLRLWTRAVAEGRALFESLVGAATPGDFLRMIETKMAWIGRTVLIRKTDADVAEAKILGLAEDGALRVRTGGRVEVIYAGSILPAVDEP
jgi:BirA family biotin operon repressor/biotin-[acetyl-CoA-carboxylase] ligase